MSGDDLGVCYAVSVNAPTYISVDGSDVAFSSLGFRVGHLCNQFELDGLFERVGEEMTFELEDDGSTLRVTSKTSAGTNAEWCAIQ